MLLSMHNLVGGYNAIRIVNGVSFELAAGETLAVLGRNGVGKTTLLRALVGLADRFAGEVLIDDQPVVARDPRCLARLGVAFVPDDRGVFPRLTVAENIELARLVAYAPSRIDPFALFPDLARRRDQPAGTLSGGQQQQLAIGRALATGPRLLVVDELSQGLQPSIVQDLADTLWQVTRETGLALILVEQNPELAMRICERVVVMQRGEVAASGSSASLASDPSFLDLLIV
ncbi:MAG: ATP-binding cassette domain-containing protein [Roseiarcus sp.]|jgi:branched-chain amino acid transport system ATP-binding protein